MRNRVIELVAVMAIQVALFGHVQVRNPRFGIKNARHLLKIEHSFSYHSHRRGVKQARQFLVLLEATGPEKEEMYLVSLFRDSPYFTCRAASANAMSTSSSVQAI